MIMMIVMMVMGMMVDHDDNAGNGDIHIRMKIYHDDSKDYRDDTADVKIHMIRDTNYDDKCDNECDDNDHGDNEDDGNE